MGNGDWGSAEAASRRTCSCGYEIRTFGARFRRQPLPGSQRFPGSPVGRTESSHLVDVQGENTAWSIELRAFLRFGSRPGTGNMGISRGAGGGFGIGYPV